MSRQLFISYSHLDTELVDQLVAVLEEAKVPVFLDSKDISWGAPINQTVRSGLESSSALLVVISKHSELSSWIPYEVGYATALGIDVLPVLASPEAQLPPVLRELNPISSIERFKEYWYKRRIPLSPLERELLGVGGNFEWQWAGQNWLGTMHFSINRASQIRAEVLVRKLSKTEKNHVRQTSETGPVVLQSVGSYYGQVSVSLDSISLEKLNVAKSEFRSVAIDDGYVLETFQSSRTTRQTLTGTLKRVPAFAGRVAYKEAETGIEREGDMVLVKYKSTVAF